MNGLDATVWWLAHGEYIKQGLTVCPECKKPINKDDPERGGSNG